MSEPSLLFSPLRVGALDLPSRIVMAPMTRARSGPHGVPTALSATYYAQRASAGLIVAEATQISDEGQGYMRTPGIHTPPQLAAWRVITDAVHGAGGRIVLQLWHVGRVSHPENREPGTRSVGPSARRELDADGPAGHRILDFLHRVRREVGIHGDIRPHARPFGLCEREHPAIGPRLIVGRGEVRRRRMAPRAQHGRHMRTHADFLTRRET